jgi:acetaldehyde dehydrogenase (acetylating)
MRSKKAAVRIETPLTWDNAPVTIILRAALLSSIDASDIAFITCSTSSCTPLVSVDSTFTTVSYASCAVKIDDITGTVGKS